MIQRAGGRGYAEHGFKAVVELNVAILHIHRKEHLVGEPVDHCVELAALAQQLLIPLEDANRILSWRYASKMTDVCTRMTNMSITST